MTAHRDNFLIIKPAICTNFSNLFLEWNSTCFGQFLCPPSGAFHCTRNNGICHKICWQPVSRSICSCSQAVSKPVWHIPLLCVRWKTPDDRHRNYPKHVEFHSKIKNFEKLVYLICSIIRNLSRCTVTWTSNLEYITLQRIVTPQSQSYDFKAALIFCESPQLRTLIHFVATNRLIPYTSPNFFLYRLILHPQSPVILIHRCISEYQK